MSEPKKEDIRPASPQNPSLARNTGQAQPAAEATPTGPPPSPGPHSPGSPHRMAGVNVEAATTRVGGEPGHDLIQDALANLEQRTIDRLPEDQKAGSKGEFRAFREQISAIYGTQE